MTAVERMPMARFGFGERPTTNDQRLPLRRPIQLLVHIRVPHDGLYVFAGFRKRNGFHELLNVAIFSRGLPVADAIISRVICCKRVLETAELVDHGAEITRSQL